MGTVWNKTRWSKAGDISDEFLNKGLESEQEVAETEVGNREKGWSSHQILCMEGQRLVRRVVTTKDGVSDRVETKLYYDLDA